MNEITDIRSQISENRTYLMGLAMLAVVFFHHGWVIIPGFTAFFSRFGLWGVDIFLFVSGFGCVYALKKYTVSEFWKRRAQRLLPTCLIVGILIILLDLYFNTERTHAPFIIRLFSLHRWYIQAIIICYVICPLLIMVISVYKFKSLIVLVAIMTILQIFLPETTIYKWNWICQRIPVFLIGMYIAMFNIRPSKSFYLLSFTFLVAAIVTRCVQGYGYFWPVLLSFACPFVLVLLCQTRKMAEKFHISRYIELMGLYSLEIYLIHEYLYWTYYSLTIPLLLKYVLFIISVTLLCFGVKSVVNYMVEKVQFSICKLR